jgi:RNA polymerase sigma-70 factor, ECF subfamily
MYTQSLFERHPEGADSLVGDGYRHEPVEPAPESSVRLCAPVALAKRVTDTELAVAAANGDAAARRTLWRRYVALVRWKLRRCIGAHDLEDHVQEAFLRFFERLPKLREHAAVRSFLIGISLRVAATELRRRRYSRLRLTEDGEVPEGNGVPTPDHAARQALARFDEMLASIGPRARTVFELRYVEELELSDVARALGTSIATTKRHLARISARVFAMVERDPALAEYWRSSPAQKPNVREASARCASPNQRGARTPHALSVP